MVNNNSKSTTGRLLSEDFAAKLPGLTPRQQTWADHTAKHQTRWHGDGRVNWITCSCGWESARVNKLDALYVLQGGCLAAVDEAALLSEQLAADSAPYDILASSGCSGDGDPQEDRDR